MGITLHGKLATRDLMVISAQCGHLSAGLSSKHDAGPEKQAPNLWKNPSSTNSQKRGAFSGDICLVMVRDGSNYTASEVHTNSEFAQVGDGCQYRVG